MAIRIPWDEQEALLLFDTFEIIEKHPERRGELIKALSINLRRRAKDNGMEIDETFRNIAGISMRISEIDKILHPSISGLTKTSGLFRTTADLYSNHRRTFLKRVQVLEEYRVKLLADLIGFDIYESVVLLDALLNIEKSGASKAYTARLVSAKLRALAISRGCVINEAYRSDTGIMGRLRKMEEAYRADIGCAEAPQVFLDTVRLYHFNRSEYRRYLKIANDLIGKIVLPEDVAKREKEKQKIKDAAPVQKTKYVKTKNDRKLKEAYPKEYIAVYNALEQRWYTDPTGVTATTIYQDLKKKHLRKIVAEILEGVSWAKEIRTGKYVHVLGVSYMATQENNEKKYLSWLKKRIPLSQYSVIEKNKNAICILLLQRRVLKKPLFMIEDAEEISINTNKISPCFSNVKLKSAAIQMVTMYATYLEEVAAAQIAKQEISVCEPTVTIDETLCDDLFIPLRTELSRQNIKTINELQKIDLWKFMNRFNLYSIGTRQTVLARVQQLLGLSSTADTANGYVLHINTQNYSGTSPAEAFLHFCEDMSIAYPLKFRSLISIRIPGRNEMAVRKNGDSKAYLKMCNLNGYVQSDLDADTVIAFVEWICQKCGKRCDNVSVEMLFAQAESPSSIKPEEPVNGEAIVTSSAIANADETAEKEAEDRFLKWLAARIIPSFLSMVPGILSDIEKYAMDRNIINGPLFLITEPTVAKSIKKAIESDSAFKNKHAGHMSKYTATMAQFIAYLADLKKNTPSKPAIIEDAHKAQRSKDVPINGGITTGNIVSDMLSPAERIKKVFIEECGSSSYGTTITYLRALLPGLDAKTIDDVLESAPWAKKKYGRWVYCADDTEQSAPKQESKMPSNPIAPITPIARQPVQSTPTSALSEKQISKDNALVSKAEEIILKADMEGMGYDELRDTLRVTMAQAKQAVAASKRIVDVKGKLIHEDAFIDWDDVTDGLETILNKLMHKNSGYVSVGQLFEYARSEMNMLLNDNDICDERSVYDIARHLFERNHYHDNHYYFAGNMHISRSGEKVSSNLDLFKKYAADQGGVFRYTGLIEYLDSVGVSTGNLRMQMRLYTESIFFNYDEDVLMFSEIMNMDESWEKMVNEALKALFADVGDHIVLRQIPGIWYERLPALPGNRPWTPLLLQSILRFYSKEFNAHTIQAMDGQSIETLHAMLVENNSPIQNFGDVVISCLLENEVEQRNFKAEDLRGILVESGILHGSELIWNMPKALKGDPRFAWDVKGENVTVVI